VQPHIINRDVLGALIKFYVSPSVRKQNSVVCGVFSSQLDPLATHTIRLTRWERKGGGKK
jgi:hypothetical protein